MANTSFPPDLNNVSERHFAGIKKTKKANKKGVKKGLVSLCRRQSSPCRRESMHSPATENDSRTAGSLLDTLFLCHRPGALGASQL